ncbi:hypothetical protein NA647_00620 [Pseudomonas stutzeri]|uniref:hypothetical protein n=1 Tax=Stutzerimonas stutzeri TaxID=316 RepID=UPI00210CD180|nr:hypothetical protein [Stutzerimonas stutzeri]MCQ4285940.1 hypothetical protein [Stutzerimonas stutzeri]
MRKWDNVTSDQLLTTIDILKHHFDPALSRKVIELFHERMQDDEHVDPDALYALMKHVFALIMEGKNADQAFGLTRTRGGYKREDTYERDLHAAAIVVLNLRKGSKWLDAVADAAVQLNISESTVKRACDDFREGLEYLPDDVLMQISDRSTVSP